jgi:hypothetical protein
VQSLQDLRILQALQPGRRKVRRLQVGCPPLWLQDLAERVEREIKQANGGAWPLTPPQWRRVAHSFGLELHLARKPMLWEGMLLGDTAVVLDGPDRWRVLRRICHEIAEGILQCEGLAPWCTPGDALTPHQAARHVDARYAEHLRSIRAAEEDADRRRKLRRARADMPELVRVRDEFTDPDFD